MTGRLLLHKVLTGCYSGHGETVFMDPLNYARTTPFSKGRTMVARSRVFDKLRMNPTGSPQGHFLIKHYCVLFRAQGERILRGNRPVFLKAKNEVLTPVKSLIKYLPKTPDGVPSNNTNNLAGWL